MSYSLIKSSVFARKAGNLIKQRPEFREKLRATLELLIEEPFAPQLKTHKLKGKLQSSYACSLGYDLRLIFKIYNNHKTPGGLINVIFLETIGTHDEVY